MTKRCFVTDCESNVIALGLCETHYRRQRKGRPLIAAVFTFADMEAAWRTRVFESLEMRDDGCWVWHGNRNSNRSYGLAAFKFNGRQFNYLTHRLMFGDIPTGLELDHLCGNTLCANPSHLEPVTAKENSQRKAAKTTQCPKGHLYDDENTHWYKGHRHCRTCGREAAYARRGGTGTRRGPYIRK